MAENTSAAVYGNAGRFKEAVCIEVARIFDSCSDKDCLEDLLVYFTEAGQSLINSAVQVKCRSAEVADSLLSVEPLPFNRGFYAVDINIFFKVQFSTYASTVSAPVDVYGLACHTKRVILFGGEGNVRTYRSDVRKAVDTTYACSLPTASLKIAQPLVLVHRILEERPSFAESIGVIPPEVAALFDDEIITAPPSSGRFALISLGVFSIAALSRDVQLMVPAYDYCVPEKDCLTSVCNEDPCDMFRRVQFPVDDFFPERPGGSGSRPLDCDDPGDDEK